MGFQSPIDVNVTVPCSSQNDGPNNTPNDNRANDTPHLPLFSFLKHNIMLGMRLVPCTLVVSETSQTKFLDSV